MLDPPRQQQGHVVLQFRAGGPLADFFHHARGNFVAVVAGMGEQQINQAVFAELLAVGVFPAP